MRIYFERFAKSRQKCNQKYRKPKMKFNRHLILSEDLKKLINIKYISLTSSQIVTSKM